MDEIEKVENTQVKILAAGAIIGALTGVGTAYLLAKNAEREGEELAISSGQGLKLGLLILGMLRQILKMDGQMNNPIVWWELATHDQEKSAKFFQDVFGWDLKNIINPYS